MPRPAACRRTWIRGSTSSMSMTLPPATCWHFIAVESGERYILGGDDMTLREILEHIARLVGRVPPRIRLPYGVVLPIAYAAEAFAEALGAQRPGDLGGRSHVAQTHVLLQCQGRARSRLPLAPAGRGVRGCRAVVSRARAVVQGMTRSAALAAPPQSARIPLKWHNRLITMDNA